MLATAGVTLISGPHESQVECLDSCTVTPPDDISIPGCSITLPAVLLATIPDGDCAGSWDMFWLFDTTWEAVITIGDCVATRIRMVVSLTRCTIFLIGPTSVVATSISFAPLEILFTRLAMCGCNNVSVVITEP